MDEFFIKLRTTRQFGGWFGGVIRFQFRKNDGWFCPITAVCYQETSTRFPTSMYFNAANVLGLARADALAIVAAADGRGNKAIRNRIKQAVGLI